MKRSCHPILPRCSTERACDLDEGAARLIHFAWHRDLRDDEPDNTYLWADIGLDTANARYLAAFAANLKRNQVNIFYGLDQAGSCFDSETGDFIPPPLGKGLTCATFILAVMRSVGFAALLEESWSPREDDAAFGQQIVEDLIATQPPIDPAHISVLASDAGAKRFRPEEVVGGSIQPAEVCPFRSKKHSNWHNRYLLNCS